MNIEYIIVLGVMIVFLIFFMYIEPIISKHKINNKNEHGSASFSNIKEIDKYFNKVNSNLYE